MYPAARELVHKIKVVGATPLFFVTWTHRDGMPENDMDNFESMQIQINTGYMGIAQELSALVAPVGSVGLSAMKEHPELELLQADGTHPTVLGTYLAACVFYAVIFHERPDGLTYRAGLSKGDVRIIQSVASHTVLNTPSVCRLAC